MNLHDVFILFASLLCYGVCQKGPCAKSAFGCCPFTKWDSDKQQCVDCTPGYLWVNCSKACKYPRYGERCNKTCKCVEQLCNVTIGCIDLNVQHTMHRSSEEKTPAGKTNWMHTSLYIVTSVLAVVCICYITTIVAEKYFKKKIELQIM